MNDNFKTILTLLIVVGLIAVGVYIFRGVKEEYLEVKAEMRSSMGEAKKAKFMGGVFDKVGGMMPAK